MSETIKVVKLPKSKMQAVRQFTNLRAFAELGPDGEAVGYYIEQDGKPPAATKPKKKIVNKRPAVGSETCLRLTSNAAEKAAQKHRHTMFYRGYEIVKELAPAKRITLQSMLISELGITETQGKSLISELVCRGGVLEPDPDA